MSEIRCIGIGTGGGDAPGLNAVIRAVVKAAILKYKWKVFGIPDGFDGLIWPERAFELTLMSRQRHSAPRRHDSRNYQPWQSLPIPDQRRWSENGLRYLR